MTNAQRKSIVKEAKLLIKSEVPDYQNRFVGTQEVIMDEYIQKVCIKMGLDTSDFWACNGKVLNDILMSE